jgi:hypothetical protein
MKTKIELLGILLIIVSCNTVKPYERINIYDSEMQLSAKKTEKHETNFQIYREGASGANGGKSGGGCGCN